MRPTEELSAAVPDVGTNDAAVTESKDEFSCVYVTLATGLLTGGAEEIVIQSVCKGSKKSKTELDL